MIKNKIYIILALFIIYFLFFSVSYSRTISNELESNIFRLHILANSDSLEDQNLKLKVRDEIIKYLSNFNFRDKNELINFINSNSTEIKNIVETCLKENNSQYKCSIEINNSFFPEKKYANVTMPAGYYDCLKIKIGEAQGHNWWCVLFPPMCLVDSSTCKISDSSKEYLENTLTKETNSIIFEKNENYKIKFKIINFANNILNF